MDVWAPWTPILHYRRMLRQVNANMMLNNFYLIFLTSVKMNGKYIQDYDIFGEQFYGWNKLFEKKTPLFILHYSIRCFYFYPLFQFCITKECTVDIFPSFVGIIPMCTRILMNQTDKNNFFRPLLSFCLLHSSLFHSYTIFLYFFLMFYVSV